MLKAKANHNEYKILTDGLKPVCWAGWYDGTSGCGIEIAPVWWVGSAGEGRLVGCKYSCCGYFEMKVID